MRFWSLFAAIALLSGCSGIQTQEVRVPIPTSCVTQIPRRPLSSLDGLPIDSPVFDSVQSLLADREQMWAYATSLEALLEACK